MSYNDEFFCPNCNATLNDQPGFDPDIGVWTCTECGQTLYGEDVEATMNQFDGVVWRCDSCGAVLNVQSGFDDSCGTWYCTECGHANSINEDEIYESEEAYQNSRKEYECPHCGRTLNDQTWFDADDDTYTCSWCDTELYKDGDEYKINYKCPHCGAELKDQWGFDEDDYWTCQSCNREIYRDDEAYCLVDSSAEDDAEDDEEETYYSQPSHTYTSSSTQSYSYSKPTGGTFSRIDRFFRKLKRIVIVIAVLIAIIELGKYEFRKLIPVQYASENLIGRNYEDVVETLKGAGFSHVTSKEISDLSSDEEASEYLVTKVSIGWINDFKENTKIPSNFPVSVTYHTLQKITAPLSSKKAKKSNYKDVEEAFKKAGFTEVYTEAKYDVTLGWFADDGDVESVDIGGKKKFSEKDTFIPSERVLITYHALKKNKPK